MKIHGHVVPEQIHSVPSLWHEQPRSTKPLGTGTGAGAGAARVDVMVIDRMDAKSTERIENCILETR